MTKRKVLLLALAAGVVVSGARSARGSERRGARPPRPSLEDALAKLRVPPAWFGSTRVRYDIRRPWKEARREVRHLLGGNRLMARQGIKLTYLYVQKKDIGNGHEYPLYLFLGGEYAWALKEYRKRLEPKPTGPTHEYLAFASCYEHFRQHDKARETLETALERLPPPPYRIARRADVEAHLGWHCEVTGKEEEARKHYREAVRLYPLSRQKYGRHLLKKKADGVRTRLDIMEYRALDFKNLRDGTYEGSALGYKGDVKTVVTVRGGKIADIKVVHKEDIDQGATKIIPKRIIDEQGLAVDGITGATATTNAIVSAAFKALKQAGLKK